MTNFQSRLSFSTNNTELGAAYPVTLPVFQGPLDLLLHLIERQELDINEVSLVAVTDQYLATIDQLEEIEPGALADFLVIASRLLYVKSRTLLPKPKSAESDEEEDPGDALIKQLLEYRKFKQIAETLRAREEAGLRVYVRTAPKPELERRLDLGNVDLGKLHSALRKALERMPSDPPMPRVHAYPITVSEQIVNVRAFVQKAQQPNADTNGASASISTTTPVPFTDLLSQSRTRMELIVTFLAVLELIKQRELEAVQDTTFSEIALLPFTSTTELE